MKALIPNIAAILFITCFFNSEVNANTIDSQSKRATNQSKIIQFDLVAIGAINQNLDQKNNSSPSFTEIMRDSYKRTSVAAKNNNDGIEDVAATTTIKSDNDITYEEYQKNQKIKFSVIFSFLLLIFTTMAIYSTSALRQPTENRLTGKLSMSRITLYYLIFLSIGTLIMLTAVNGFIPKVNISFFLIVSISITVYLFNRVLERFNVNQNNTANSEVHSVIINASIINKLFSNPAFLLIHYPIVSFCNLLLILIPAWIDLKLSEIRIELLIIQMLSSMVFIGIAASRMNLMPSILIRNNMTNS
ncbi:MAG: hypothetical protein WED33_02135 [Bacteroidia bacterium]